MSEDGRSRSTLSSSSTALSNAFYSSAIRPCTEKDDYSRKYTENWVKSFNKVPKTYYQLCHEISLREATIDKNQAFAQNCRKAIRDLQINGGNAALIASRNNELLSYEKKIEESEAVLISIGLCPVMSCTKHHEARKDATMDTETGISHEVLPGTSYEDFPGTSYEEVQPGTSDEQDNQFSYACNLSRMKTPLIPPFNTLNAVKEDPSYSSYWTGRERNYCRIQYWSGNVNLEDSDLNVVINRSIILNENSIDVSPQGNAIVVLIPAEETSICVGVFNFRGEVVSLIRELPLDPVGVHFSSKGNRMLVILANDRSKGSKFVSGLLNL
ncbi:hypothetical protein AVEN_106776-1 [Araneus ventricosus]|uniref:Uncharacterized protein n=1 Tax=Araneus ventricosus TaxID=182803 RepID=A0A4Y2F5F2_ARAVE|nr:hypothetical protein AVEN_106776-1 [Araneus ventricosus]